MLKFLLNDEESLWTYMDGKFVSLSDIKRRIFLEARKLDYAQTDSHIHLAKNLTFSDISSISEIFTKGLPKIASQHLELKGLKLHVKTEKQNNFQELVTLIPPLLLQSTLIFSNHVLVRPQIKTYFNQYILGNTRYTAIPSPRIGKLYDLIERKQGLDDLHIHLSGTMEADMVWQDYLYNPEAVYNELNEAFHKEEKVREQFEQESRGLSPLKYRELLKTAQRLRTYFYNYLFPSENTPQITKEAQLEQLIGNRGGISPSYLHPFLVLITNDEKYPHLMSIESLMHILILSELRKTGNDILASMFHFYLLLLGNTNRFLVQQIHQNGFEQFQKHTLNAMRESSEAIFRRRYYQLHGNDLRHLNFLEGRFSPKDEPNKMANFVDSIFKGWEFIKKDIKENHSSTPEAFAEPTLKLIAHFIKRPDSKPDIYIRHKALRWDLKTRAEVLYLLLKNHPRYKQKIVGIDAAASEFDAPPEVFSPAFRKIKRKLVPHRTFHAGEDFYHIISGLRAIYEAIEFCGLIARDRIGHATATGISTTQWTKLIGKNMLITKGEYLDNLIFTYHLIKNMGISKLSGKLEQLATEIENTAEEIYGIISTANENEAAWLMRHICPLHAFKSSQRDAEIMQGYSDKEWNHIIASDINKSSREFELFKRYHDLFYRKKYQEVITVSTEKIIDKNDIHKLQLGVLKYMSEKEIIIETLPTSNVRIGIHKNFDTYHLWNWIKWKANGKPIPPIIVGSDDAGIFATNIYNEYSNIFCMLSQIRGLKKKKVMKIIEQLKSNSEKYRFESSAE